MLKLTGKKKFVKSTDFNIIVQSITDREGTELDLETAPFCFDFFDSATLATIDAGISPNSKNLYRVSYIDGVRTNNTYEDGVLRFQFENYPFSKGKLCYKQTESYENNSFSDNSEDIVTIKSLPIDILTSGTNDTYTGDCFATVSIGALRGEKGEDGKDGEDGESAEALTPIYNYTWDTVILTPNTYNTWADNMSMIDLCDNSFEDWAEGDEAVVVFTNGDTPVDFCLHENVVWLNDNPIDVEANTTYICSIKIIGGLPIAVAGVVNETATVEVSTYHESLTDLYEDDISAAAMIGGLTARYWSSNSTNSEFELICGGVSSYGVMRLYIDASNGGWKFNVNISIERPNENTAIFTSKLNEAFDYSNADDFDEIQNYEHFEYVNTDAMTTTYTEFATYSIEKGLNFIDIYYTESPETTIGADSEITVTYNITA